MSVCAEAALPAAPANPSADAHAARLAKFERERLIVDYLNRGVSVAEIAVQLRVGEKRTRAIIREILARRMPAPPEQYVAIQVSRLNEALLVAYSAMAGMNFKAVDRVVKIVRELDRYHGFTGAERRLPEVSRLEATAQGLAFGAALLCGAELAPQEDERRDLERLERAEAVIASRRDSGDVAIQRGVEDPVAPGSRRFARDDGDRATRIGSDERPENPVQGVEKVE